MTPMKPKRLAIHTEDPELYERIDRWRCEQSRLMSRSEAVRLLLNKVLPKPETVEAA